MSELKRCPFCGGEVRFVKTGCSSRGKIGHLYCDGCKESFFKNDRWHRDIYQQVHNKLTRPDWCPLKPFPDKKPNLKAFPSSLNDASWNAGYNNCINDILEDVNEQ